jgi:putative methyltransferase (TIGR04325 family)
MSLTGLKRIARLLVPPIGIQAMRWIWRKPDGSANLQPTLEYAPDEWKTRFTHPDVKGWDSDSVANTEEAKWEEFRRDLEGAGPLGFSHEHTDLTINREVSFHNVHITYAYVLALTAHLQTSLSVLDWGGGLGHYYLIGKAVLPDVSLDFHCKEVPSMAAAGQRLNPEVHWYADDSCLERSYDLVMVNGSLQYMEDWKETLRRLAKVTRKYLFLTRVPVVEKGPGFIALQRLYDSEMLHQQFNQAEVLQVVSGLGLHLVREFVVGDRPHIENAPEQCELRGWLFRRDQV